MGAVTPTPADILRIHYSVYTKWRWTDTWEYSPYLEPISAKLAAAPAISTAVFKMRYGSGMWEDSEAMTNGSLMKSYCYCYVQIRSRRGKEETILWTGVIPAETFNLLGQSGANKTADQLITASGLEILLKNRLNGAWVKQAGEDPEDPENNAVWIDRVPVFNRRHKYGGNIIGNKSSTLETDKLTYVFSNDNEIWYNYEIAEYLLAHFNYENGPQFYLSGEEAIEQALYSIIGVYDFSSMTVLNALNVLISRGRGFGWYLKVMPDDEDGPGEVYVVPFSLLDEDIKLGEIIMPANPKKLAINLWSEKRHANVEVTDNVTSTYDKIVVRGARMKCCCSLSFDNGGLEKGWSDEEETAFKTAASKIAGYDEFQDDEKADVNDKFRAEDRFERVFTTFRVPHDWKWLIKGEGGEEEEGGEIVCPLLDSVGELRIYKKSKYWNADKSFANALPFKVGIDYSGSTPVDNNPEYAEPEFRRMFVLVKDADDKYQYADKLKPHSAAIRPLAREMGISMRFRPSYLASKNRWSEAEPADWESIITIYGIDYEDIIATVFIETDQVVKVEHTFNYFENQRTLIITIPDAELWYVVPGTIIGIDKDGACIKYGGTSGLLRDDRERLKAALATAMAWYGKERNQIVIKIGEIDPGIPLGTLLENVDVADVGAIGSVVTAIEWNFQKPASTTITTDHGELDIAGIFIR